MRRYRNPRYAPESLERRLSPSGTASAIVAPVPQYDTTTQATDAYEPPPAPGGNGVPPIIYLPPPTGPVGPA